MTFVQADVATADRDVAGPGDMPGAGAGERCRLGLTVRGLVQGVGFRPHVYVLATDPLLAGSVANTADDVEVEGETAAVDEFARRVVADAPEEGVLTGAQRPIVLLPPPMENRDNCMIGDHCIIDAGVAPGSPALAVFLPYTPLHVLLLGLDGDEPRPDALVMTSGNFGGEPIVATTLRWSPGSRRSSTAGYGRTAAPSISPATTLRGAVRALRADGHVVLRPRRLPPTTAGSPSGSSSLPHAEPRPPDEGRRSCA
jgi:acylphosphatase